MNWLGRKPIATLEQVRDIREAVRIRRELTNAALARRHGLSLNYVRSLVCHIPKRLQEGL